MATTVKPAWLFVPGDRNDRYTKAAERSDVVIVDLEDAVSPAHKADARKAFLEFQNSDEALDPTKTVVRINPVGSEWFHSDLKLLSELPGSGYSVMLPKVEDTEALEHIRGLKVYALIETVKGVVNVDTIAAHEGVTGLMWGAEDLFASLGGGHSRTAAGDYRAPAVYTRARVLMAAKAHGKLAIDSVWTDIDNLDDLGVEADDAVNCGFDAKALIHPKHVEVVREAFRPSGEQLEWARGVIQAASNADAGAWTYQGQMIDEPLLQQARNILARA